jgi:hypothetical protein
MTEENSVDKINNDPQEPTPPTGQVDLQGRDPSEFIEEHVKDNYRGLNDSGRSFAGMADEAQRMGDRVLEAWLRDQKDSKSRTRSSSVVSASALPPSGASRPRTRRRRPGQPQHEERPAAERVSSTSAGPGFASLGRPRSCHRTVTNPPIGTMIT